MKYKVYKDRAGEWRWRLVASNGNTVTDSGRATATRLTAWPGSSW
jgi:uncharacterized protein YegP (UPF0339 family)